MGFKGFRGARKINFVDLQTVKMLNFFWKPFDIVTTNSSSYLVVLTWFSFKKMREYNKITSQPLMHLSEIHA